MAAAGKDGEQAILGGERPRLELATADFGSVVLDVLDEHRAAIADRGLQLVTRLAPEPLWARIDYTRISQAVGTLVDNAIRHTDPPGEIEVFTEHDPERSEVRVVVRDTGSGLDPSALEQLFLPSPSDADRDQRGLWPGLPIVRALADLHGGAARAASQGPGQGATFTLALPAAPPPHPGETAPPRHAASLRVLLVEDNPDNAYTLEQMLMLEGHEVAVAGTGEDALRLAPIFRPQVVLCDLGLPGAVDGYGVARALRSHPPRGSMRLVALTGYGSPEDQRRSREAGFDEHLIKPVDLDLLRRAVCPAP